MKKPPITGCVLLLVMVPLFIFAVHRYLPLQDSDLRITFAIAAGLLLALGLSSLVLLLAGKVETAGDVMEKSLSGALADGDQVLVSGRLRATAPLLTAPISGTPCVAWFYRMYKVRRFTADDSPLVDVPVYWGYASTPFVVETSSRSVAVRAAFEFNVPRTPLSGDNAIARARELIRTTPAGEGPRIVFAGDQVRQWMRHLTSAEDGSSRHDWKSDDADDPAALHLEESLLLPNVEVSVHGPWSAKRNGIAAARSEDVKVALGSPSALGGMVPRSLATYWISTLITIALGAGVIWFALKVWPRVN